jgi:hypothetical protein
MNRRTSVQCPYLIPASRTLNVLAIPSELYLTCSGPSKRVVPDVKVGDAPLGFRNSQWHHASKGFFNKSRVSACTLTALLARFYIHGLIHTNNHKGETSEGNK